MKMHQANFRFHFQKCCVYFYACSKASPLLEIYKYSPVYMSKTKLKE